jgi:hypothetical protein
MMPSDPRWKTALHESGHLTAAHVLGGKVYGAVLFPDLGGLASFDELSPDAVAFATAAGPIAGTLSERFDPPALTDALPTSPLTPDEIERLPVFDSAASIAADLGRSAGDRKAGVDDDVSLAQWAIQGRWDDPDCWAERVAFAQHVAGEIVRDNADTIVRVARELYTRGSLGATEITQLLEG